VAFESQGRQGGTRWSGGALHDHRQCCHAVSAAESFRYGTPREATGKYRKATVVGAQVGGRTSCIVFFDAKSDVPYADAIHAIDLIEQLPGRVVLLTPETKRVHIP
jgi:hypothetical protein